MGREYTKGKHRFEHWYRDNTTTLLNNHYHTLGYLGLGPNLGPMMQRIHGSVAKHQAIELERGLKRALELRAFLVEVPYPRHGESARK